MSFPLHTERYSFVADAAHPLGHLVDRAASFSLADLRARSIRDVRDLQRRKVAAVHTSLNDAERLQLVMIRYMRLVRKSIATALTAGETAWLNNVDALLARAWAIRQAADDIEAEIAAKATNADVFDHNAALEANPLWPE